MPERPHWPARWPFSAPAPAESGGGMVASTDLYATEVGVEVLRAGGNAVDAAVAVSFALAVVNPEAGNLGGGGFLLFRRSDGLVAALDYRSTAPAGASGEMFLDPSGRPTEASVVGHRAVAVPGSVWGLAEAHGRFGRVGWADLVGPAVELARGFTVTPRLTRSFTPEIVEGLRKFGSTAEVFLPGGAPPRVGDTFRQPELARTLERIRDGGADAFYEGETAELIAAEMLRGGGVVTREDLAAYQGRWREPVRFGYRSHTVLSMPPSSSGGVALGETCAILRSFDLEGAGWHSTDHVHLLAEAWRRAYADRNHYLADPDFHEIPVEILTSAGYGRWRGRQIRRGEATPSSGVAPGVERYATAERADGQTTHLSIVDGEGGAVSLTTTLNTWYGSKVVVPGTGVLLNNEMDDLTAKPGAPNFFGLVQGEANAVEPGKRPLSAMTPTIVLDPAGELLLVVGTPGGATITTTVFQVVSNVIDHGMGLAEAVAAPRVHHQHLPDRISYEPEGLEPAVIDGLEAIGHHLERREEWSGDVQAVSVTPGGGLLGVSDPRRGGSAAGV